MNAIANLPPAPSQQDPWARALDQHRLSYPDVHVVRFLAGLPRGSAAAPRRGIDVGFGSGQHLGALADFGYETWGTELLAEEVAQQQAMLGARLHGGKLLHGHLADLPELEGRFDVAVAWGVACLNRASKLVDWLQDFRALLAPGGRACLNFRSRDNWFYGLGEEVEPHCFNLDRRAGPYADAVFTFLDEAGVRAALTAAGFTIDNLERDDWWKNNLREHHSWWIARVRNETR